MPTKSRPALPAWLGFALLALLAPSARHAATPPPAPTGDNHVAASLPNTTYGSNAKLRTDGSPVVRSYLRFDVQNWVPGSSTATLRLMPTSSLATGLQVSQVPSTSCPEATTNASNAPALGAQVATTTPPTAGTW